MGHLDGWNKAGSFKPGFGFKAGFSSNLITAVNPNTGIMLLTG